MTSFQKLAAFNICLQIRNYNVALVLALNCDVDPPDVTKPSPCARLQAWYDPTGKNPQHAVNQIGNNLQKQYEAWQPRARYKLCLDPTVEDVKKLCQSMRRCAKEDRVVYHYNGHGVPRPTENGEIWVFNKNYTQYIPLSIYDLQSWMGAPSVYVFDCHNAERIIRAYYQFCEKRKSESHNQSDLSPGNGASEIQNACQVNVYPYNLTTNELLVLNCCTYSEIFSLVR